MILEKIKKENDIKELSEEELEILADEIREFLIQKISVNTRVFFVSYRDYDHTKVL